MISYNDFLKAMNVPTEEIFNKVIKTIPTFDEIRTDDFVCNGTEDSLTEFLICSGLLYKYQYAYLDSFDFKNKTLSVYDLSLKELEELNKELSEYGWRLENYEEYKQALIEQEVDKYDNLLDRLKNVPIEEIENLIMKYDK